MKLDIPTEVLEILKALQGAGFDAFVVGGSVRDLLMGKEPKDWDVATSAKPEAIQELFPDSFYTNEFGTVGVKTGSEDEHRAIVEITTFRTEESYSDKRHPDKVSFTTSLDEDLARRDFTVNAMALAADGSVRDPFEGQADLEKKVLRAVGTANERFNEDALRLMRAVRFATVLGFALEERTYEALKKNARLIDAIANERIRDELIKILESERAHEGVELLREAGLLERILPEVTAGVDVTQNKHHIYSVYEHNLRSLQWAAENDYALVVRIAALLHDVGKPQTKRGEGPSATFYGHDVVGARIARKALERLHFPRETVEKVAMLIRYHMFYYDIGEVTERSVRRLLANVGKENMDDLVKVRICDRMGSGVPKPEPYRLRHFQYMVEKVQNDPISVGMLKVRGDDIMAELDIEPGPKVGQVLAVLLEDVLDEPERNTKEYLLKRADELGKLSDKELAAMRQEAKKKQQEVEEREQGKIKKRYYVE
ncbi:MAG: HDIG domain-containing metalloprotein [Candidatus Spechtbacterales bacterium]